MTSYLLTMTVSGNNATFQGLDPTTDYEVSVGTVNSNGEAGPGKVVWCSDTCTSIISYVPPVICMCSVNWIIKFIKFYITSVSRLTRLESTSLLFQLRLVGLRDCGSWTVSQTKFTL